MPREVRLTRNNMLDPRKAKEISQCGQVHYRAQGLRKYRDVIRRGFITVANKFVPVICSLEYLVQIPRHFPTQVHMGPRLGISLTPHISEPSKSSCLRPSRS